jgi:hypothetical protein
MQAGVKFPKRLWIARPERCLQDLRVQSAWRAPFQAAMTQEMQPGIQLLRGNIGV